LLKLLQKWSEIKFYLNALLEGLLMGLMLTVLAGPILFALLQAGIEQGFKAGMMVALGVFFSDLMFVIAVYFGLSYILAIIELDGFELTLGITGGIALILIGVGTLLSKPPAMPDDDYFLDKKIIDNALLKKPDQHKASYLSLFAKGFFINTANPFTFFFWGVIATAKMAESNFSEDEFFLFFGGILFMIFASDTLKVLLAKIIRKKLKPKKILLARKMSGIAFVIFGVILMLRVMV